MDTKDIRRVGRYEFHGHEHDRQSEGVFPNVPPLRRTNPVQERPHDSHHDKRVEQETQQGEAGIGEAARRGRSP